MLLGGHAQESSQSVPFPHLLALPKSRSSCGHVQSVQGPCRKSHCMNSCADSQQHAWQDDHEEEGLWRLEPIFLYTLGKLKVALYLKSPYIWASMVVLAKSMRMARVCKDKPQQGGRESIENLFWQKLVNEVYSALHKTLAWPAYYLS